MRLSYDLHIHSCLSPCGDDDMTPANIVGMAALKGLDVIAVTDHNSCKNCPAVLHFADRYGLVAVPGMELCTSEEIHALCLFPELKQAMEFDAYVYDRLIRFTNKEEIFGKQQIYNMEDEIQDRVPWLLINSADISFQGLWELVMCCKGVMIPAHLDRTANSLISNLGAIPPDSCFPTAELRHMEKLEKMKEAHPYLEQCRIITNSDAHYLENINEPVNFLEAEERTAEAVVRALLEREKK